MLISIAGISLVILNVFVLFKDTNRGIIIFFISSLVYPVIWLQGIAFSYELLAFIPIILAFFFKERKILISLPTLLFFVLITLILLMTTISLLFFSPISIGYSAVFGMIRICILIILAQFFFKKNGNLSKILIPVFVINFVFVIVQSIFRFNRSIVEIFYNLYSKPSFTVLESYLERGFFNRPTGTFLSPVLLGFFCLISFTFFYTNAYFGREKKFNMILSILAIILGLLSFSKTAYIGIVLVILITFLLKRFTIKPNFKISKTKIFIIIILTSASLLAINFLRDSNFSSGFKYYIAFIFKPLEIFETRYGYESGLIPTFQVIMDHLLLGVGKTSIIGELAIDSLYISFLHDSGIIGLSILILAFICALYFSIKFKNYTNFVLLIVFMLASFGSLVIIYPLGILVFAKFNTYRNE